MFLSVPNEHTLIVSHEREFVAVQGDSIHLLPPHTHYGETTPITDGMVVEQKNLRIAGQPVAKFFIIQLGDEWFMSVRYESGAIQNINLSELFEKVRETNEIFVIIPDPGYPMDGGTQSTVDPTVGGIGPFDESDPFADN